MKIYVTTAESRFAGLMSYFLQTVGSLNLLTEDSDKFYVKFDYNMLYQDPKYGKNVWEYYFHQPFNISKEEAESVEKIIDIGRPGRLDLNYTLNSIEHAHFIVNKYIHLKDHIKDKIESFLKLNVGSGEKLLAVHKRGTDHINDAPILPITKYFDAVDAIIDNYDKLLICSDEEYSVEAFKERYKDKVIYYNSIRATEPTAVGIHHSIGLKDPYKMGEDVVIETYLMARADYLIRTTSNVSYASIIIGKNVDRYLDIENA